ncbi:DNA polymerase [Caudoviricetes sp.]|nr:DNA polymerase [Caudoviricetes sp.]
MGNILVLDVETTTSNKGNPFDQTNKCVCVGVKWKMADGNSWKPVILYDDFSSLQEIINRASLVVGFNIKFDLHWLRKIGIDISNVRVWDCQLAEFILNNQKTPYPSLDDAAIKYGFPKKLDVVKTEYWDKGIDTDKIPKNILSEYLSQDLILTQQVFEKQWEIFKTDKRLPLFKLQCLDLLVLEEMEYNGILFNTEEALKKAATIEKELDGIYKDISISIGGIPINLSSNDHVSALLYGGHITEDIRIPVGVYKSGEKIGQVRNKILTKEYILPRIVEPLEGTEVKKSTPENPYWEVNETTLRSLKVTKEAKKIITLLDNYGKLEKLRGTYLEGYAKLIDKMNWPKNMLYGTLNQCVAITGRLSSSKPNLQNADPATKVFMETQYG